MEVVNNEIQGLILLKPRIFTDARGYFLETYSKEKLDSIIGDIDFVQDNESYSTQGVIRGLHYQIGEYAQAKLVSVSYGRVLDVVVDIRIDSPTFGEYYSVELSGDNKYSLFIPRGFAHGFSVLSEYALFRYKCDNYYSPNNEGAILFNDKSLGIDWMIPKELIKVSDKDLNNPTFENRKI